WCSLPSLEFVCAHEMVNETSRGLLHTCCRGLRSLSALHLARHAVKVLAVLLLPRRLQFVAPWTAGVAIAVRGAQRRHGLEASGADALVHLPGQIPALEATQEVAREPPGGQTVVDPPQRHDVVPGVHLDRLVIRGVVGPMSATQPSTDCAPGVLV